MHNERTKLLANFLNSGATAAVTVGILAPLAAAMFRLPTAPDWLLAAGVFLWLGFAVLLHVLAHRVLGELR